MTPRPTPGATTGRLKGRKTYVWASTAQVSQTIPWSGWAACGLGDSRYKHVKDYTRPNIDPRMYSNYARLYCGRVDSVPGESTFGYWHIKDRHMNDWQNKANYIGRGWQDFLGWVFSYEFRDPGRVTRSSSTRFCYQRTFYLYDLSNGEEVDRFRAIVYTGETGRRILTAFPTNPNRSNPYMCKGTIIG